MPVHLREKKSTIQKHSRHYMGLDATKPAIGVPTERDSNQSPQLQRLARKYKTLFDANLDILNHTSNATEIRQKIKYSKYFIHCKAVFFSKDYKLFT